MPANLSKRSVVKHRTRQPFHIGQGKQAGKGNSGVEGTGANSTNLGIRAKGKGRSGFQVGPKHAPDGAYLGRAKKIKADLIEKAKIKKRFFKSINNEEGINGEGAAASADTILHRNEGKFAPEQTNEELNDGSDILYQMRNRGEVAVSQKEKGREREEIGKREKKLKQVEQSTKVNLRPEKAEEGAKGEEIFMSKEERQKIREAKTDRWHSQSGSQRGRDRGQPNLGARMDLLLDRIKQTT